MKEFRVVVEDEKGKQKEHYFDFIDEAYALYDATDDTCIVESNYTNKEVNREGRTK